ncbi:MAG: hypothetical protein IJN90_05995 [Bacilli bacterium]|nr:hypothetical protein [Bacilli bacterium]MBQ7105391.1 hypothetical protein [Bacilli bacterium]
MTYIYDLVLNWSDSSLLEFFEWEENDEIEYVKKIPVFKIDNLDIIRENCIKVNVDFLNKIHYKTEVYGNKKIDKVEYCCVFCNYLMNDAVACEFNSDGECIYRSIVNPLDIDDFYDIEEKTFDLQFDIIHKYKNNNFYFTRSELKKKKILLSEIDKIFDENNEDKIKYFYYELFGEIDCDIFFMKNKMINHLKSDINFNINKFYELINVSNFI